MLLQFFTEQGDWGADKDLWRADRQNGEELAATPQANTLWTQSGSLLQETMDVLRPKRSWGFASYWVSTKMTSSYYSVHFLMCQCTVLYQGSGLKF